MFFYLLILELSCSGVKLSTPGNFLSSDPSLLFSPDFALDDRLSSSFALSDAVSFELADFPDSLLDLTTDLDFLSS